MDATRLAYLAGLIDGEGTITISRTRSGVRNVRWSYHVRLLLVNTDRRLIDTCREITGVGCIYQSKADANGATPANWNPIFRYQVVGNQARKVIADVRPYLIAKAAHADIALGMPVRSRNIYDRSAVPAQEAAFGAIAELNRRGRRDFARV